MTDFADIISNLETATGPDRNLDADIAIAVGGFTERHWLPTSGWVLRSPRHAIVLAPNYTGSIDAALKLLPELIWLEIQTGTQCGDTSSFEWAVVACGCHKTSRLIWRGQAKTIPLALCRAAFHALEFIEAHSKSPIPENEATKP